MNEPIKGQGDAAQASSGGINLEVVNKIAAGTATAEEVQAHCMGLWRNGWIPTKWEHAKLGTEEMPVSGDVALRSTNGAMIAEVSRDLKSIGYGGATEYRIKDASGKEIVVESPRLAIAGAGRVWAEVAGFGLRNPCPARPFFREVAGSGQHRRVL
jgi:hypothetical protein